MTTFQLKLAAVVFMLIDHIGLIFFPNIILLRIIGRLSFPLIAWLIANGAIHTSNMRKYLERLLLLSLISQLPFIMLMKSIYPNFAGLNVVFTLFLGLCAIYVLQTYKNLLLRLITLILISGMAVFFKTEYGLAGLASIVCFYLFYKNFKLIFISQLAILTLAYFLPSLILLKNNGFHNNLLVGLFEPIGILSIFLVGKYNGQIGKKIQYFFYIFYPLQLLTLYFLKLQL